MYQNYYHMPRKVTYQKDDRFIPFAGPFLLGALTGGVAVAATGPRPRPNYYPGPYGGYGYGYGYGPRPPYFY